METSIADERRQPPGPEPSWSEWWSLLWWADDRSAGLSGGAVRVEVFPNLGRTRVWVSIVGEGRRLVTLVEQNAPLPRPPSLELRCSGLWVDVILQTPGRHMTVGLEAFGVALDDPAEARTRAWGDRTPIGLDLEWESDPAEPPRRTAHGFGRAAFVHGDVLVADEIIDLEAHGWRSHGWGAGDPATWDPLAVGVLGDGTWICSSSSEGLPSVDTVALSPVAVDEGPGEPWIAEQALVRYATAQGHQGTGWTFGAAPRR